MTNIINVLATKGFSDFEQPFDTTINATGTGNYWEDYRLLQELAKTVQNGEIAYARDYGNSYAITMWSPSLVIGVDYYYNTEDFDEPLEEDF